MPVNKNLCNVYINIQGNDVQSLQNFLDLCVDIGAQPQVRFQDSIAKHAYMLWIPMSDYSTGLVGVNNLGSTELCDEPPENAKVFMSVSRAIQYVIGVAENVSDQIMDSVPLCYSKALHDYGEHQWSGQPNSATLTFTTGSFTETLTKVPEEEEEEDLLLGFMSKSMVFELIKKVSNNNDTSLSVNRGDIGIDLDLVGYIDITSKESYNAVMVHLNSLEVLNNFL